LYRQRMISASGVVARWGLVSLIFYDDTAIYCVVTLLRVLE